MGNRDLGNVPIGWASSSGSVSVAAGWPPVTVRALRPEGFFIVTRPVEGVVGVVARSTETDDGFFESPSSGYADEVSTNELNKNTHITCSF